MDHAELYTAPVACSRRDSYQYVHSKKKSLRTSSSFTSRLAITTSFASLCTGRKPRGRISHIPQPNWCDATNPRPRGQVLRPGGPTTFRPFCYTSLLSGCAMSSSANKVGKTDALVTCSMRGGRCVPESGHGENQDIASELRLPIVLETRQGVPPQTLPLFQPFARHLRDGRGPGARERIVVQLGEAAGGRVQRSLFGLAGLVDEAVEEPLQNGVARGRRQCPVCELNGVRVSHAPVGVGFRIRVAFNSPYGVDGLSSLRGCLQEPTARGAVEAMRFARQFVGPFCNVGLLNPTGGMLERFRVNVPVLELSAWGLTRILRLVARHLRCLRTICTP